MNRFILSLSILISTISMSQNVNVRWGHSIQVPRKSVFHSIIAKDENNIYALRFQSAGMFGADVPVIEQVDALTLNIKSRIPLVLPIIHSQQCRFHSIRYFNNQLNLLSTIFDKKSGYLSVYLSSINISEKRADNTKLLSKELVEPGKNIGTFKFLISADSSKSLLLYRFPKKKESKLKFKIQTFNYGFDSLASIYVNLPYEERICDVVDMLFLTDQVIILLKISDNNERTIYKAICVDVLSGNKKEIDISPDNCKVEEVGIQIADSNKAIIAGFCSNTNCKSGINAAFYYIINQGEEPLIKSKTNEFSKKEILQFVKEKQFNKGQMLENVHLKNLQITQEGNIVISGEEQYITQTCTPDPRTGLLDCIDNYYHNDIVIFKTDSSGSKQWLHRIPKNQYSNTANSLYTSFIFSLIDEDVYILFNDDPRNLSVDENSRGHMVSKSNNTIPTLGHIYSDGSLEKRPVFISNAHSYIIYPKYSFRIKNDRFILYTKKGKSCSFGNLEFR